jgi:hypothetical protein
MNSNELSEPKSYQEIFQTEDFPLACFLVAKKAAPFMGCVKGEVRMAFLFDISPEDGQALNIAYVAGAEVKAITYHEALRKLRKSMTLLEEEGRDA